MGALPTGGKQMINIERAKRTPSTVFASPQDVVDHKNLTKEDKIEILLRWRNDAIQLQRTEEENMAGDDGSQLQQVLKALRAVGHVS